MRRLCSIASFKASVRQMSSEFDAVNVPRQHHFLYTRNDM